METNDRLFDKFIVTRNDGKPEREGARYFTFDYAHDPAAQLALLVYADLVNDTMPGLAMDLRRAIGGIIDPGMEESLRDGA